MLYLSHRLSRCRYLACYTRFPELQHAAAAAVGRSTATNRSQQWVRRYTSSSPMATATVAPEREKSSIPTRTQREEEDEATSEQLDSTELTKTHGTNKPSLSLLTTTDSMKQLVSFSQPEWSYIGASAATLAVTSSITLLLPYAAGQVIDTTISGGGNPLVMAGGLFGLMTASGVGVYYRSIWLSKAGNRIVARLRQRAYEALLHQNVEYIETLSKGDFLSRLSSDAQLVQSAVTTEAIKGLRAVIMTTGSGSMLLYTSPTLAAVSLCTLPPIFIAARFVGRKLQDEQKKVQELQASATSLAEQALSAISTVKQQYHGESYESHRYAHQISEAHTTALQTAHLQAQLEVFVHIAANGAVLGVLGYGGTLVLSGALTAGDLVGFVMYSFVLSGNMSALSGIFADVSRSIAASDRVMEILNRKPATVILESQHDNENPLDVPDMWMPPTTSSAPAARLDHGDATTINTDPLSVRIENLAFSYPSRSGLVLDGLSLNLEPGKILSLVGGSGSGKSTVASLLTRLYDVPRGTIYINDKDICDYDPQQLRQQIGIVSQEPVLFKGTIADNIRYGMWDTSVVTDEDVYEAAKLAHVLEFTDTFHDGLETRIGAGTQLSGGQKQRVAIARTLLKNPPLVILDEATSSLDARSEHLVQEAMNQIMQSNKTVLSIAHRLSTIRHSDLIAVLEKGKVVEQGTFDELSQQGRDGPFYHLMKTQLI